MHTQEPLEVCAELSLAPIDAAAEILAAADPHFGATTVFVGSIRDHDPQTGDQQVEAIEYSAHPSAQQILEEVTGEVVRTHFGAEAARARVRVVHRLGRVEVGEPALLVIASTAHRQPGISFVPDMVETIKARVPIWKNQKLADGGSKWSNLP